MLSNRLSQFTKNIFIKYLSFLSLMKYNARIYVTSINRAKNLRNKNIGYKTKETSFAFFLPFLETSRNYIGIYWFFSLASFYCMHHFNFLCSNSLTSSSSHHHRRRSSNHQDGTDWGNDVTKEVEWRTLSARKTEYKVYIWRPRRWLLVVQSYR